MCTYPDLTSKGGISVSFLQKHATYGLERAFGCSFPTLVSLPTYERRGSNQEEHTGAIRS